MKKLYIVIMFTIVLLFFCFVSCVTEQIEPKVPDSPEAYEPITEELKTDEVSATEEPRIATTVLPKEPEEAPPIPDDIVSTEDGNEKLDIFEIAKTGTAEELQAVITAGAEVHAKEEDGQSPLMIAAQSNENPEVFTVLLNAGADGSLKDITEKTAFDYAKDNPYLKGTRQYWELNDAQYR